MSGNDSHAVYPPAASPSENVSQDRGRARAVPGVIVPTTHEPITIESLKRRKRLPASYVALKGDFRPLQISSDYDRFVRGPLQAVLDEIVSFELVLDGDIDCGRSWELPVLVAHWLEVAERAEEEGRGSDTAAPLVWATGMVDADLRPLPSDYHIPRKIAVCAEDFAAWRADFGRVIAIVPKTAEPEEEARLRDLFAAEDVPVHFIADFEELDAVLSRETGRAVAAPAADLPAEAAATDIDTRPDPRRKRGLPAWLWGVAGLAAVGLFVFFVPVVPNGSGLSTLLGNSGDKEQAFRVAGEPALTVNGLYAEDRTECIEKIFSGAPLDIQSATKTVDGFSLQTGAALCGLAFRNRSLDTIEVTLDADLIARGIAGSSTLATPMVLGPNQTRELIFSAPPGVLSAGTQVSEPGAPDRHWTIRLQ